MVRLKHRYLLVNILYPDPKTANVRLVAKDGEPTPYNMQFRQPSSDAMNIKIMLRVIRDGVTELFGDYGSGKIAGSLQSMSRNRNALLKCQYVANVCYSQVFLPSTIDSNHPSVSRPLPPRLGRTLFLYFLA